MHTGAMMTEGVNSVSWGSAPFSFQLSSTVTPILQKAATIFRPWRLEHSAVQTHRWLVESAGAVAPGTRDGWSVCSTITTATLYRTTIAYALMAIEYQAIRTLIEFAVSPPALHSALVAKDGAGVLIIGRGEAGKSTLSCALWRRGWTLLSDDCCLIESESGVCTARPVPRRVSLRAPSRALLGDDLWARIAATPSCDLTSEGLLFHPNEIDGRERATSVRLAAAVFLGRRGVATAPATLVSINPAQFLIALLPYSTLVRKLAPGEAIHRLNPLAATVPGYDLGRGNLSAMVERVEELLRRHA